MTIAQGDLITGGVAMSNEEKPCENCVNCPAKTEEKVKDSWLWIRDAKGYGSVTVTFTTVAFWVTTIAYVLAIFEKIGPISIRPFDVAACSAYFVPVMTLYWGRKFTEAKFNTNNTQQ